MERELRTVTALLVGAAVMAAVSIGAGMIEGDDGAVSIKWVEDEAFSVPAVLHLLPFYTPTVQDGETRLLWIRAYNNANQPRIGTVHVAAGNCLTVDTVPGLADAPGEIAMGTIPANRYSGLQQLRITGDLPENAGRCTADLTATLLLEGEQVAEASETVNVVSSR